MKSISLDKPGISLVSAAPISEGVGLLILSIDELFEAREPHSFLAVYSKGIAKGVFVPSSCVDVIWVEREGYFLGEDGVIWQYDGLDIKELSYIEDENNINAFRSHAYSSEQGHLIAGGGHYLFGSKNALKWESREIPINLKQEGLSYTGFEKVLFASEGAYVWGWKGMAYLISKGSYKKLELPTNLDLHDACVTESGVAVCGNQGVVISGSEASGWSIIENNITDENFWGICEFEKQIFVSNVAGLYCIEDSELALVDDIESENTDSSFYGLKCCNACLWSIGAKHLYEYKGGLWQTLIRLG